MWDFLKGPVESLLGNVGSIVDELHMSGEEKAKAKVELAKIQNEFALRVMDADAAFAKEQGETIRAEVASKSWLAANWRPILMLTFTYIIAHNFIIAPMFSIPAVQIPTDMWDLIKLGVSGYIVGRSAEKIIPHTKMAKD